MSTRVVLNVEKVAGEAIRRSRGLLLLVVASLVVLLGCAATAGVAAAAAQGGTEDAGPSATPAVAASQGPGSGPGVPPVALPPTYKIVAGDVLSVQVIGHADLTQAVSVLPDGTIQYPYLGEVYVRGRTIEQVRQMILAALKKQLNFPRVTVSMLKRNMPQVAILGSGVRGQAGKRDLGDGWRIANLIGDAAGLTVERPEWVKATLVRSGGAQVFTIDMVRVFSGDPEANILLEPDDVLMVEVLDDSKTKVQVLGEVTRPGPLPAPANGSVITVLTAAGGPTPKAALAFAAIRRSSGEIVSVNLVNYDSQGKAPDIKIEPGDTLLIPENKRVYSITGAVMRPIQVPYPEDREVTMLEALTEAGGPASGAELKSAVLMRRAAEDGKKVEPQIVDLDKILKSKQKAGKDGKAPEFADPVLQPGDVVFIPTKEQRSGQNFLDKALQYLPFFLLF